MLRIVQIGSFGRNLGDIIALRKIRESLSDLDVKWTNHDFRTPPDKNFNSHDACIIGGGGLFEGGVYSHSKSGWKLGITEYNMPKIPIFICGVGLNDFRGIPSVTGKGLKALKALLDTAKIASVRSDGTYEKIKKLTGLDILEIPDPGLISNVTKQRITNPKKGCISVAHNSNTKIIKHRKFNNSSLKRIIDKHKLDVFPHTQKDYMRGFRYTFGSLELHKQCKQFSYDFLNKYIEYDYCIAVRGHGQLVPIGMNIPTITLSTQDKLLDFSKKNGLMRFTADTSQPYFEKTILGMIESLKTRTSYLNEWYEITTQIREKSHKQYNDFIDRLKNELSLL